MIRRPPRHSSTDALARTALMNSPVTAAEDDPLIEVRIERDQVTLAVQPPIPNAAMEAMSRAAGFLQLPPGWNSYRAKPIAHENVIAAITFLFEYVESATPKPDVVPTTKGGVQIEWHINGIDLEVLFSSTGPEFYGESLNGEPEHYPLRGHENRLKEWISWLSER